MVKTARIGGDTQPCGGFRRRTGRPPLRWRNIDRRYQRAGRLDERRSRPHDCLGLQRRRFAAPASDHYGCEGVSAGAKARETHALAARRFMTGRYVFRIHSHTQSCLRSGCPARAIDAGQRSGIGRPARTFSNERSAPWLRLPSAGLPMSCRTNSRKRSRGTMLCQAIRRRDAYRETINPRLKYADLAPTFFVLRPNAHFSAHFVPTR